MNLKSELFRYLVENKGCRAICYEFNYERSLEIDDYVINGRGNIDSLLYDLYWIQSNKEVRRLLAWMREYNSSKEESEKVHFTGIDCQLDMFTPERLQYNVSRLDQELSQIIDKELTELSITGRPEYRGMKEGEFKSIEGLILTIKEKSLSYINSRNTSIKTASDSKILHLIDCMLTSHTFLFNVYNGKGHRRDEFMAENILWALKQYNESSSIAVWAHNAHLCVVPCLDPHYYPEGASSMGFYLREKLMYEYQVIGTSFNRGQITAVEADTLTGKDTPPHIIYIDTIPPEGSVNRLFESARYKNFVLNLGNIDTETKLYTYLDTIRPFLGVGDFYIGNTLAHYKDDRTVKLAEAYDIIFHIENSEALHLSGKWEKSK
jgi:erythromycin esterase